MVELTSIKGRDLSSPYGNVGWVCDGGLNIRIDDENRPDFWIEVKISAKQLEALLASRAKGATCPLS